MLYEAAIWSGNCDNDKDYTWWVYSKDPSIFIPVPLGKVPVLNKRV